MLGDMRAAKREKRTYGFLASVCTIPAHMLADSFGHFVVHISTCVRNLSLLSDIGYHHARKNLYTAQAAIALLPMPCTVYIACRLIQQYVSRQDVIRIAYTC